MKAALVIIAIIGILAVLVGFPFMLKRKKKVWNICCTIFGICFVLTAVLGVIFAIING